MGNLPDRRNSLAKVYQALQDLVDDLGAAAAAAEVGVSPDTIRRRVRGTQPWFFEEVVDLARHEIRRGSLGDIARSLIESVSTEDRQEAHPLLLPSNLREMLRLVGRLTTEIADTLDDGRVDRQEARRLIELLGKLDQLTAGLRVDLEALSEPT